MLTLLFFSVFPIHGFSASDPSALFASNTLRVNNTLDASEQNERRGALVDYARKQAMNWLPGLPDTLRDPARWMFDGFHAARSLFDVDISTLGDDDSDNAPDPVARLMQQPPASEGGEPAWLASTSYHHRRGILPTHDAVILGAHARQDLLDKYMRFDLHPYYGQNYFSQRNYYGGEMALDLAPPADMASASKPWGKIVIGYTNGDDRLMDHGRGIDLHGEVRFNDRLSLNTGLRQSDTTGSGNYVLLQWKMSMD